MLGLVQNKYKKIIINLYKNNVSIKTRPLFMKETENFYVPNIDYCYTVSASLDGKEYIFSGYQKKEYIFSFSPTNNMKVL